MLTLHNCSALHPGCRARVHPRLHPTNLLPSLFPSIPSFPSSQTSSITHPCFSASLPPLSPLSALSALYPAEFLSHPRTNANDDNRSTSSAIAPSSLCFSGWSQWSLPPHSHSHILSAVVSSRNLRKTPSRKPLKSSPNITYKGHEGSFMRI